MCSDSSDDNNEDICSTQSAFAFNIMEMRQKGVDYSDIYHLMNINNKADLTTKGMDKLDSYKGVFEEAYDYPVYESKIVLSLNNWGIYFTEANSGAVRPLAC